MLQQSDKSVAVSPTHIDVYYYSHMHQLTKNSRKIIQTSSAEKVASNYVRWDYVMDV